MLLALAVGDTGSGTEQSGGGCSTKEQNCVGWQRIGTMRMVFEGEPPEELPTFTMVLSNR